MAALRWLIVCGAVCFAAAHPHGLTDDPIPVVHNVSTVNEFNVAMKETNTSQANLTIINFLRPMTVLQERYVPFNWGGHMRQLILNASAVRAAGGHVTIVSQGAGRYFSVNQGAILAAENIEFVGNGTGMLAVFGGKLRLVNCTLRGGTGDWPFDHGVGDATAVGGGALYLLKSDATLQNCVLGGNSDSRRGGAIGGAYSTLVMSQCFLHDNVVHKRPGAVKIVGRSGAASDDVPEGVGGAVSLTQASVLMCSNTTFHLNRAMEGGSAIALGSSVHGNITRSSFEHNGATCEPGHGRVEAGGALLLWGTANISLQNVNMRENSVYNGCKGGGLYVLNTTRLSLLNCNFAHNLHETSKDKGSRTMSSDDVYLAYVGSVDCRNTSAAAVNVSERMQADNPSSPSFCHAAYPPKHTPWYKALLASSGLRYGLLSVLGLALVLAVVYPAARAWGRRRARQDPRALPLWAQARPVQRTRGWFTWFRWQQPKAEEEEEYSDAAEWAGAETRIEASGEESTALQESLLPADTTPDT